MGQLSLARKPSRLTGVWGMCWEVTRLTLERDWIVITGDGETVIRYR